MIRLSAPIRRSASVASGVVILYGCATQPVASPEVTAADRITTRPGRPGFVVGAPHGDRDVATDEIAAEIARRTGFGLVVASGVSTPSARQASAAYERRVLEAAQGPLRFYAELHRDGRTGCAGQIAITTVGIDREFALRLRTLAELVRDAHLRSGGPTERLDVQVEPVDAATDRAPGAGRAGILRLPERGLQIDLPRCPRREWRDAYAAILADFLTQAVVLPVGR